MRQNVLPSPPAAATLWVLHYKHMLRVASMPLAFLLGGVSAFAISWALGWSAVVTAALMLALFSWRGSFNLKRAKPLKRDLADDAAVLSFISAAATEHRQVKRYLDQLAAMERPICWHDAWTVTDWAIRESVVKRYRGQ